MQSSVVSGIRSYEDELGRLVIRVNYRRYAPRIRSFMVITGVFGLIFTFTALVYGFQDDPALGWFTLLMGAGLLVASVWLWYKWKDIRRGVNTYVFDRKANLITFKDKPVAPLSDLTKVIRVDYTYRDLENYGVRIQHKGKRPLVTDGLSEAEANLLMAEIADYMGWDDSKKLVLGLSNIMMTFRCRGVWRTPGCLSARTKTG